MKNHLRLSVMTAFSLVLAVIAVTWGGHTVGRSSTTMDATPSPVICDEGEGTATPDTGLPNGLYRVFKGSYQSDQMSELQWNGSDLPLTFQWGMYRVDPHTTFHAAESSGFTISVDDGWLSIQVCDISPTGMAVLYNSAGEIPLTAGQSPIELRPGDLAMFAGTTLVISTGTHPATFKATGITLGEIEPCSGTACWEPPCNNTCTGSP